MQEVLLQSSGVWPNNLTTLSDIDCAPASVTDCPYHDCTAASPTHPPPSELLQLCPENVSLSKMSTDLITNSMTYCVQSKSGSFTIYSPHDIRHCPTPQKRVNIGWKRKFQ